MSKPLKLLAHALLAASFCAPPAVAQTPAAQAQTTPETAPWVNVSPAGETFAVLLPKQPAAAEQRLTGGGMSVVGKRYAADDGRSSYLVWSLQNPDGVLWERLSRADRTRDGVSAETLYLDHVAELSWELLVSPEIERLTSAGAGGQRLAELDLGMSYVREFRLLGRPAREYSVRLEKARGPVYVCADGARVYVVAALAADPLSPNSRRFVESFAVGAKLALPPTPVTMQIDPALLKPEGGGAVDGNSLPGRGGNTGGGTPVGGGGPAAVGGAAVDYAKPFRQNEVTKRALITRKPEPAFTESARRFNVTGVVRLRAILSKTGEVTNVSVVRHLPHGLTEQAIAAAYAIGFEPAEKDGRKVSQYVVLEYNFLIY